MNDTESPQTSPDTEPHILQRIVRCIRCDTNTAQLLFCVPCGEQLDRELDAARKASFGYR